jgi:hypothetical protein
MVDFLFLFLSESDPTHTIEEEKKEEEIDESSGRVKNKFTAKW